MLNRNGFGDIYFRRVPFHFTWTYMQSPKVILDGKYLRGLNKFRTPHLVVSAVRVTCWLVVVSSSSPTSSEFCRFHCGDEHFLMFLILALRWSTGWTSPNRSRSLYNHMLGKTRLGLCAIAYTRKFPRQGSIIIIEVDELGPCNRVENVCH